MLAEPAVLDGNLDLPPIFASYSCSRTVSCARVNRYQVMEWSYKHPCVHVWLPPHMLVSPSSTLHSSGVSPLDCNLLVPMCLLLVHLLLQKYYHGLTKGSHSLHRFFTMLFPTRGVPVSALSKGLTPGYVLGCQG
jgi:hypothetical protein